MKPTTSILALRRPIHSRQPLDLAATSRAARALRQPVVIVPASRETAALRQRVAELESALATAQRAATERAQREDRVAAITVREVDNTAAFAARLGRRSGPARVVITTQHVDVA